MILSWVRYGEEAAGGDSAPATASGYPIIRLSFKGKPVSILEQ